MYSKTINSMHGIKSQVGNQFSNLLFNYTDAQALNPNKYLMRKTKNTFSSLEA